MWRFEKVWPALLSWLQGPGALLSVAPIPCSTRTSWSATRPITAEPVGTPPDSVVWRLPWMMMLLAEAIVTELVYGAVSET